MTRWLYSCFMWLAQSFMRRKLRRRGRQEPGYLEAVEERFGRYLLPPLPADGNTLWVHAVSLGETRAAAVLIVRLRERLPGMRLLLTHGTASGRAAGAELLQPGDIQTWQPWDTPGAVARFLRHFNPCLGLLMETELWPNLVAGCQHRQVPLVLANARMSEKSRRQAQRLAWLSRPALRALSAVWAQTEDDALRLRQLGAQVQGVFGNLKFDATLNVVQLAAGRAWNARTARPVLMFASSREGEEAALLEILASSVAAGETTASAVQWLIVPRHPQRFEAVAALSASYGFAVSRRSSWSDGPPLAGCDPADPARPLLWLGDSLGDMALYYGLADVALLGGSFAPLGGQNLIEAAACACPVVMGPHTFNFAEVAALAEASGAALRVADMAEGVTLASALVVDPARRVSRAQAASDFAGAHRGAVDHTVTAMLALLDQKTVDTL
jgi:3-deoxy-D-manno-octulosonic-acid transferase